MSLFHFMEAYMGKDNEEIRIVQRQETFNDLAVREIARNRAACICRIQFGRCTRERCRRCDTERRFANCYWSLSDYDRLRLDSCTADEYKELSANPFNWYDHKTYIKKYVGFVAVICLFVAFFPLLFAIAGCSLRPMPEDRPSGGGSLAGKRGVYRKEILDVMDIVSDKVWDMDKDGKVNCVDHAIMFKVMWDLKYPALADKCEIVRNYNPGAGMHHLFNMIKVGSGRWAKDNVFVEPWAHPDISKYLMEENWSSSEYDPAFNQYGDTKKWLNTIR